MCGLRWAHCQVDASEPDELKPATEQPLVGWNDGDEGGCLLLASHHNGCFANSFLAKCLPVEARTIADCLAPASSTSSLNTRASSSSQCQISRPEFREKAGIISGIFDFQCELFVLLVSPGSPCFPNLGCGIVSSFSCRDVRRLVVQKLEVESSMPHSSIASGPSV